MKVVKATKSKSKSKTKRESTSTSNVTIDGDPNPSQWDGIVCDNNIADLPEAMQIEMKGRVDDALDLFAQRCRQVDTKLNEALIGCLLEHGIILSLNSDYSRP